MANINQNSLKEQQLHRKLLRYTRFTLNIINSKCQMVSLQKTPYKWIFLWYKGYFFSDVFNHHIIIV